MRAPTWRLALHEGGGPGGQAWLAEARGTEVRDLSADGPTAVGEGTVDAGSLEGGGVARSGAAAGGPPRGGGVVALV